MPRPKHTIKCQHSPDHPSSSPSGPTPPLCPPCLCNLHSSLTFPVLTQTFFPTDWGRVRGDHLNKSVSHSLTQHSLQPPSNPAPPHSPYLHPPSSSPPLPKHSPLSPPSYNLPSIPKPALTTASASRSTPRTPCKHLGLAPHNLTHSIHPRHNPPRPNRRDIPPPTPLTPFIPPARTAAPRARPPRLPLEVPGVLALHGGGQGRSGAVRGWDVTGWDGGGGRPGQGAAPRARCSLPGRARAPPRPAHARRPRHAPGPAPPFPPR